MFNDITWPEAIVILGLLIFAGFIVLCLMVGLVMRSEKKEFDSFMDRPAKRRISQR